jgi:ribosome maturation protein Sdo1
VAASREKAIKAFAVYGLKPDQVFKLIDVKGEQDIGISELLALRAMFSSLKNGEATVDEMLAQAARGSTNFDRVANPLQDDAAEKVSRRKAAPSSGAQSTGTAAATKGDPPAAAGSSAPLEKP